MKTYRRFITATSIAAIALSPMLTLSHGLSLRLGLPSLAGLPGVAPGTPAGSRPTGTRGCGDETRKTSPDLLTLLFQSKDGHTVSGRPTFFWYLSANPPVPIRFVLASPEEDEPAIDEIFENPRAGFMQAKLADKQPELVPGRQYIWSVTLLCNRNNTAENPIAQGQIKRVPMPPDLAEKLTQATSQLANATIYANQGFWYDALAIVAAAQAENPKDNTLQDHMLSLLGQMGHSWVVQQEQARLAGGLSPSTKDRN